MQPNLEGPALEAPQTGPLQSARHITAHGLFVFQWISNRGKNIYIYLRKDREGERRNRHLSRMWSRNPRRKMSSFYPNRVRSVWFSSAGADTYPKHNSRNLFFCGYGTIPVMMQKQARIRIKGRIAAFFFFFSNLTTCLMPCFHLNVKQIWNCGGKKEKRMQIRHISIWLEWVNYANFVKIWRRTGM